MNHPIDNILYATDLGPRGPEVFRRVMDFSRAFDAKIHVIHVLEPLNEYAETLLSSYMSEAARAKIHSEGLEEVRQEMERRADKICKDSGLTREELEEMVGGVHAVQGVPHEAILEAATQVDADIIVMGSHERAADGEMLLGSVAHKVILKSKVPVVFVPIGAAS